MFIHILKSSCKLIVVYIIPTGQTRRSGGHRNGVMAFVCTLRLSSDLRQDNRLNTGDEKEMGGPLLWK